MGILHRIDLVKLLPENSMVAEIGVAEGNFSCDLLDAGAGVLYSIDACETIDGVTGDGNFPQHWHDNNFNIASKRLSEYGYRSRIIKKLSKDAAFDIPSLQFDMIYLDAGHYYDAVISDLRTWYPKLKHGDIMAGHDFLNEDYKVMEAVYDFVKHNGINATVNIIPENNPNDASFYFIKP